MYKKAWCTSRVVVLLIYKPIAFLPFSLPSPTAVVVPYPLKIPRRPATATELETSLRKWIRVLSISIAIILTPLTMSNAASELLWSRIPKFRGRNEISSFLVNVLHKTWNQAFSRRSRAVTAEKCTIKGDARAKLLLTFCLFILLLFWRSRCRCCRGMSLLVIGRDVLVSCSLFPTKP